MRMIPHVAVVYSGDASVPGSAPSAHAQHRFQGVCEEFERQGIIPELIPYRDEAVDEVRHALRGMDAALIWVNPLDAVDNRDLLTVQDIAMLVAATVLVLNAAVDISYRLIDPRTRGRS